MSQLATWSYKVVNHVHLDQLASLVVRNRDVNLEIRMCDLSVETRKRNLQSKLECAT